MNKQLFDEYQEFIAADKSQEITVPQYIDAKIRSQVANDLSPSQVTILTKLLFIQLWVGLVTMFFCPQFDMSFTSNQALFHFFHRSLGAMGCMAVCGAIFMGSGAIVAASVLSLREVSIISENKFLIYFSMSGIAVAFFMLFGAETYFLLSLFWILGGAVSAAILLAGTRWIRLRRALLIPN